MQDSSADDAGQGDSAVTGLEILGPAIDPLTLIFPVLATVPVIEQHRKRLIVCGGDRLRRFVYYIEAIRMRFIVSGKEILRQGPEVIIDLSCLRLDVPGRKLDFVRQLLLLMHQVRIRNTE